MQRLQIPPSQLTNHGSPPRTPPHPPHPTTHPPIPTPNLPPPILPAPPSASCLARAELAELAVQRCHWLYHAVTWQWSCSSLCYIKSQRIHLTSQRLLSMGVFVLGWLKKAVAGGLHDLFCVVGPHESRCAASLSLSVSLFLVFLSVPHTYTFTVYLCNVCLWVCTVWLTEFSVFLTISQTLTKLWKHLS